MNCLNIAPAKRIVACMLRLDKIYETLLSLQSRVRVANVLLSTGVGLGSDGTDKRRILLQRSSNRVKKVLLIKEGGQQGLKRILGCGFSTWVLDIGSKSLSLL